LFLNYPFIIFVLTKKINYTHMKKIYSLLAAALFTTAAFAQAPGTLATPSKQVTKVRTFDRSALKVNKNKAANKGTAAGNAGWFNYGLAYEALTSAPSVLNSNYLFPDSMGYGDFGGTFAGIWIHHLAEVADFRSIAYAGDATTSWVANGTPFTVDSMSVFYAYTRNHPNPNIVDTLVITLFDNTTANNVAGSGFLNASGFPGGADTLSFKRLGYRQSNNLVANATNTVNAPVGQYKFKVPLTIADTAIASYRDKGFAVPSPFLSSGGKVVVADVQFIPGYTYTLTQQIDATANAFFFASLEENGASTLFNFFDCNFGSAACDYNSSQIVPQDVRYNMASAGTWKGRFIPAMAYTAPYAFEHHLISFKLSEATGIKNNVAQNTFGLTQNMPNPYSKESVVSYNLAKDVNSAVFTVTDVMGRVVSSENVGTTTGSHSVKLGAYAAGVYYYSLNVDGNVTTKKMIVE